MDNITELKEKQVQGPTVYYRVETTVVDNNLQEVLSAIKKTQHTPRYWTVTSA